MSPEIHASKFNYFIWQDVPLCKVGQYLQGFNTHKRSNYPRTETASIHTMAHQSSNPLQRADKSSTAGIYFLRSRVKQFLLTPWELSAQQRGNRECNLEMHSRIQNTLAEKVTEILQSRNGDFKPEPNTSWKPPTDLSGLICLGPFCLQPTWSSPLPRRLCFFPDNHAHAVILNTLQSGTRFHLLAEDHQVPN